MAVHAPLTTLPPELLSTILSYLSLKDTLSLLLTTKSLYPASQRSLWSTLHLCDRIPDYYKGPPCPPFIHDPERAVGNDGCRKLAKIISNAKKNAVEGGGVEGFRYIRGLVLEPEVFSRSTACMKDGLLEVLGDEIAAGRVEVRWVKASVWGSYLETTSDPPEGIERFLKILKTYSESKTADEFSFILDTNFIATISQWFRPKCSLFDLIDMSKVTSLDIQLEIFNDEEEEPWPEDEDEDDTTLVHSQIDADQHSEPPHDREEDTDRSEPAHSDIDASELGARTPLGYIASPTPDFENEHYPSTSTSAPTSAPSFIPPPEQQPARSRYLTPTATQITDLTRLLRLSPSLRILKLTIESEPDTPYTPPPLPHLLPILYPLSQTFLHHLPKLHTLQLVGPTFHPSFFIHPGKSVKKYVISSQISPAWFRSLAQSELSGVKHLEIYHSPAFPSTWTTDADEADYEFEYGGYANVPRQYELGDVKFSNLETFWVDGIYGPGDLIRCVQRANRGLEKGGKKILEVMKGERRVRGGNLFTMEEVEESIRRRKERREREILEREEAERLAAEEAAEYATLAGDEDEEEEEDDFVGDGDAERFEEDSLDSEGFTP